VSMEDGCGGIDHCIQLDFYGQIALAWVFFTLNCRLLQTCRVILCSVMFCWWGFLSACESDMDCETDVGYELGVHCKTALKSSLGIAQV